MKITINGIEAAVDEGTTILEAAEQNNVYIPTLCHVRGKNAEQPCGLCVVEVEGSEAPVRSCETRIKEGMVISIEVPYKELGLGGFQIEYTLLVKKDGCELLYPHIRELVVR